MIKKLFINGLKALGSCVIISSATLNAQSAPTASQTYFFTGSLQQFTVPPCVGSMTIELKGASGGAGTSGGPSGANGGLVRGVMTATPGQVFNIYVGGQSTAVAGGYNGGGDGGISSTSSGGGGGGGTDIRLGGTALANRIIVAAGGGGGGGNTTYGAAAGIGGGGTSCTNPVGVGGGAASGFGTGNTPGACSGGTAPAYASGGAGGGLTSGGGGGGQPSSSTGGYGCNGTLGVGGAGGGTSFICGGATGGVNGGGGGGGGYYGGGGGMTGTGGGNGGGGGGSSFAQTPLFSNITFSAGNLISSGNGSVLLIYAFNGSLTNATITPFALCAGQTATISANGSTTYTWNTNSNSNSITVNPTSNTTYTVTGTNSIGCVSSAVITVTVTSGSPTLAVTSSTNQICLGKTATLTANGALSYTWSGGVTNGLSFTPTTTSNYTVLGQNGCGTTSAVTSITVAPLPVSAIVSPTAVCAGLTATLTAVSAGTSYTWMPFSLPGASVVVSPSATTIFTVSATDGTCSGIATVALVANANPTITSSISNSNICQGAAITLSASGALGYTWTPGNQTGAVITVTPNSPTQYSVMGNNSIGCFAGSSQVVIVSPSPTLIVSANNPIICSGGSSTLNVSGADTYTWAGGANTTSNVVNPVSSTSYSITGTYTNGPLCSSGTIITVSVFVPTLSISGGTATCLGNSVNLNASAAGTWLWSNGATSQGISVSPNSTTVYSVTALTTSGSINCPSSSSIQVTVYPNPTLTATSSRSAMCKGENNNLFVSGASTYSWNNGSNASSITITPSLVTIAVYTINGTSNNGCLGTTSISIKVNSCVGLNEFEKAPSQINIYPNPNNGNFVIESDQATNLNLINELGQVVKNISLTVENKFQARINDLPIGMYIIVSQNNDKSILQKVIITK